MAIHLSGMTSLKVCILLISILWISACSDMTLDKKPSTQLVSKVVSPIHHSSFRWKIARASLRLVLNAPSWSYNGTESHLWLDLSAMSRRLNKIPFTMETILIEPKLIRKDVYMLELIVPTTVHPNQQAQMDHCIYLKKNHNIQTLIANTKSATGLSFDKKKKLFYFLDYCYNFLSEYDWDPHTGYIGLFLLLILPFYRFFKKNWLLLSSEMCSLLF